MKEVKLEAGFPFTSEQVIKEAMDLLIHHPDKWEELEKRAITLAKNEVIFLHNMMSDPLMETLRLSNPELKVSPVKGNQIALVELTHFMAHEIFDYMITKQQSKEK